MSSYHSLIAGHNSGGTYQWEFASGGGAWLAFYSVAQATESDGSSTTQPNTTNWCIYAYTKAAGSATGRFHRFTLGGAWAHQNGNTTIAGNPATISGGTIRFGEAQDVDDYSGRLAVAGVWTSELTDPQIEALATNLQTSDWATHTVTPAAVWEFNQPSTATPVEDLVGTSDQTVVNGTSVLTTDDPAGWTFDGAGAVEVVPALVMAPMSAG